MNLTARKKLSGQALPVCPRIVSYASDRSADLPKFANESLAEIQGAVADVQATCLLGQKSANPSEQPTTP